MKIFARRIPFIIFFFLNIPSQRHNALDMLVMPNKTTAAHSAMLFKK